MAVLVICLLLDTFLSKTIKTKVKFIHIKFSLGYFMDPQWQKIWNTISEVALSTIDTHFKIFFNFINISIQKQRGA